MLKKAMEARGLSQSAAARLLGLSPQNFNNKLYRGLSISDFETYCKTLGFSLEVILYDENSKGTITDSPAFKAGKKAAIDETMEFLHGLKED
jgi:transcriptional regulator with XRE-family HTH domain